MSKLTDNPLVADMFFLRKYIEIFGVSINQEFYVVTDYHEMFCPLNKPLKINLIAKRLEKIKFVLKPILVKEKKKRKPTLDKYAI